MRTALGALSLCATLAACGPPPPQASVPPAPPPAFDGMYRATIALSASGTGVNTSWCDTPGQATLQVVNDHFNLDVPHPNVPGNPVIAFEVDVAPNGMFQAQASTAILAGQIVGPRLQALINGPGCNYSVTATRV